MKVIFDTNVFVAAGFNRSSSSARLVGKVERGELELVWNEATLKETRMIVSKIPPLDWRRFEGLFKDEGKFEGGVDVGKFGFVEDKDDRKFAGLADATNSPIVTNDDHLLTHRKRFRFEVMKPGEFLRNLE